MSWKDIQPWVAKLAPTLGAALGPMGAVAGAIIGSALGVKDASPESIADAIKTGTLGPDQIVALKTAEQQFQLQMAELGYDSAEKVAELEYKDRDSARAREVAVRDHTPAIGFYGITVGFFGILGWMLVRPCPPESKDVLNIMLGSLGTAWTMAVAYYYGSSLHSTGQEKP